MDGPRNPNNLRSINGGRKDNPFRTYGDLFVTALITALGTVVATLSVHAIFNRKSSKSAPEPQQALPPQQPTYILPPSPFVQPALPQGGMFVYVPQGSQNFSHGNFGSIPNFGGFGGHHQQQQQNLPAALQYAVANPGPIPNPEPAQVIPRPTRTPAAAANDAMPGWFSAWVKDFSKKQDSRFANIENLLSEDQGDYDEEADAG